MLSYNLNKSSELRKCIVNEPVEFLVKLPKKNDNSDFKRNHLQRFYSSLELYNDFTELQKNRKTIKLLKKTNSNKIGKHKSSTNKETPIEDRYEVIFNKRLCANILCKF
jgi:hypothetical protein